VSMLFLMTMLRGSAADDEESLPPDMTVSAAAGQVGPQVATAVPGAERLAVQSEENSPKLKSPIERTGLRRPFA
jgi:hypothetical protein